MSMVLLRRWWWWLQRQTAKRRLQRNYWASRTQESTASTTTNQIIMHKLASKWMWICAFPFMRLGTCLRNTATMWPNFSSFYAVAASMNGEARERTHGHNKSICEWKTKEEYFLFLIEFKWRSQIELTYDHLKTSIQATPSKATTQVATKYRMVIIKSHTQITAFVDPFNRENNVCPRSVQKGQKKNDTIPIKRFVMNHTLGEAHLIWWRNEKKQAENTFQWD